MIIFLRSLFKNIIDYGIFILGGVVGWKLSFFSNFHPFKFYNVIGITFDIVGVVLLTYLVATNEKVKEWIATTLAVTFVKVFGFVPISMAAASLAALAIFKAPSAELVLGFVAPLMLLMLIPIFTLEDVVIYKRFKKFQSVDARIKFLGGFFLISGLLIQLIAAVEDMAGDF